MNGSTCTVLLDWVSHCMLVSAARVGVSTQPGANHTLHTTQLATALHSSTAALL